jgi:fatty-acyl-CoA synthase
MIVPFSVCDFIDRAAQVYGDRVGVVDEPDQPANSLGAVTYAEMRALAARQAARLDELEVGFGDRVAIVSHNSARLLTSFFGVAGYGRVLVPVNFRLRPDEVSHIVAHSGARVLLIDPELDDALATVIAEHRFVLGDDDHLYAPEGAEPKPWTHDENATACINYTSGTTARPKGVQMTHRNIWTDAVTFGLHAGVTDRDVYLHTLPMFHVNGWGMPFAAAGLGVTQIALRKIDGAEILRRVEKHGVTFMCAAPAVVAAILEAAVIGVPNEKWGETIKALVVLAPGEKVTEAQLIAWCKEKAAGYKAPTSIEFRDELARTATGKLQKFKLRAPYWEGREHQVN